MSDYSNEQNLKKSNLLVVDDDKLLQLSISKELSQFSFINVVGTCNDGDQVVDFCRKNPVDVILMDFEMRRMNGDEATKLVLKHFPKIKIIAHSSNDEEWYRSRMIDAGAIGYVYKTGSLVRTATIIKPLANPDYVLTIPVDQY